MAKSKSASKSPKPPRGPLLSDGARRGLMHTLAAVVAIAICLIGLLVLRQHVWKDLAFTADPPKIILKNRPAWMGDYLAAQIIRSIRPPGMHSALDDSLLKETADLLNENPWIAKVHQVRRVYGKQPGDTVEIDCEFRAPVALVKWGVYYWLVDGNGVKLPEQYTADLVPKVVLDSHNQTNIRIIEGVKNAPPETGHKWQGDDLTAGLEMIRLLFGQPFVNDVVKVDVTNFAGRVDVREAQIVLVTRWDTQVRWGRPVNASDFFIEIPTARKLQDLQMVYAKYGRVDANQKWIDIRYDQITYPAPGTPGGASADVRR